MALVGDEELGQQPYGWQQNLGGPVSQAAGPAAQPSPFQTSFDQFQQFLAQQNPFFTQAADQQLAASQGMDPLLEQYRQAGVSALQGSLARRGITGSAGLNEVNKLNLGYTQQGMGLADQRLSNSLSARSAALTQAGFPISMINANIAAQNAGKGGDQGGGDDFNLFNPTTWF